MPLKHSTALLNKYAARPKPGPIPASDIAAAKQLAEHGTHLLDQRAVFETDITGLSPEAGRKALLYFREKARLAERLGDYFRAGQLVDAGRRLLANRDALLRSRESPAWTNMRYLPQARLLFSQNAQPADVHSLPGSGQPKLLATGKSPLARGLTRQHEIHEIAATDDALRRLAVDRDRVLQDAKENAERGIKRYEELKRAGVVLGGKVEKKDIKNLNIARKWKKISDVDNNYLAARLAEKKTGYLYMLGNNGKLTRVTDHFNEDVLRRDAALRANIGVKNSPGVQDAANLRKKYFEDKWLERPDGQDYIETPLGTLLKLSSYTFQSQ